MTNTAPDLIPGYPSKGRKVGPAWNELWAELQRADDFQDGRVLAERIAPKHDLEPSTLVALLSRMAKGGILDRESRPVQIRLNVAGGGEHQSSRRRTHYRIAA